MAVRRPLNFTSGSLKELSDAQLEMLSYLVRKAYAYKLADDFYYSGYVYTTGNITPSTGFTRVGSFYNRYRNAYSSTNPDVNTYPPNPDDEQGDFTDLSTTVYTQSWYMHQRQGIPAWPESTTHDSYSYLYYNTTDDVLTYTNSETDIKDTITTNALNELQNLDGNGDEVGSYRLSAATNLGSDWYRRSVFALDYRYGYNRYYYLHVRMKNSTYESTYGSNNVPIVRWDGSSFKEISIDIDNPQDNNFISSILLPSLARIAPKYELSSTYDYYRGGISDTLYLGSTFSVTGPSGSPAVYTGTFTPSGTISSSSLYLNLVPR